MNQLTKVYEDGTVKATYTYNPDGTLKTSSYGSQTASYSYNLANLLTEVNNANSGTQISKYNYTYYVDGNQKSKSESVAGTDKGTTNYTYDGVNRLVTEQAPDKTLNYQYDSYGNRSQLSVTGDETYTTSYTYDKNNRLRKQTKTAGSASEITDFWYDPNGNQISSMTITTGGTGTAGIGIQPAGQSMNSYSEYNSWNQLISTMQNGKTASYAYNGDGLRMRLLIVSLAIVLCVTIGILGMLNLWPIRCKYNTYGAVTYFDDEGRYQLINTVGNDYDVKDASDNKFIFGFILYYTHVGDKLYVISRPNRKDIVYNVLDINNGLVERSYDIEVFKMNDREILENRENMIDLTQKRNEAIKQFIKILPQKIRQW